MRSAILAAGHVICKNNSDLEFSKLSKDLKPIDFCCNS